MCAPCSCRQRPCLASTPHPHLTPPPRLGGGGGIVSVAPVAPIDSAGGGRVGVSAHSPLSTPPGGGGGLTSSTPPCLTYGRIDSHPHLRPSPSWRSLGKPRRASLVALDSLHSTIGSFLPVRITFHGSSVSSGWSPLGRVLLSQSCIPRAAATCLAGGIFHVPPRSGDVLKAPCGRPHTWVPLVAVAATIPRAPAGL